MENNILFFKQKMKDIAGIFFLLITELNWALHFYLN